MNVPVAIGLVFLGCCSNLVFLELIIKEDSGASNIITFSQFLFVAMEGFFVYSHCVPKKTLIPMWKYVQIVVLFFTVSVLNNYALSFNIPLPLHLIFRAGSLMANMVLGIFLAGKRYSVSKYVAVGMITAGISVATLASTQMEQSTAAEESEVSAENASAAFFTMCTGIGMLIFALFASARMGLFQEVVYKDYGKHPREALFITHALPLPGFLLLAPDIWSRIVSFTASEVVNIGVFSIPKMWLYILGNCLTQYVCIRNVYYLTTECPSLVVTLVVTLRKFTSLLFSIFYFQNPFTLQHWIGTALVFLGTALFMGVLHTLTRLVVPQKPKEE